MSHLFLRTLRDDPADAEVASHKLLVRAGYVRRIAPGVYSWLPLGLRVLREVERVVREEMNAMGAQEILLPALLPRDPYETSNRWTEYGAGLFRLKDRKGNDMMLGPTHEELFALTVKGEYNSYKDFPVTLYQVQTKYRDEERPRAGILRGREFVMKDSYSFDLTDEGLTASYQAHRDTYERILARLGVKYVIVSATSGAMGGSASEEFLAESEIGEDTYVRCLESGYAANVEAVKTLAPAPVPFDGLPPAEVRDTPDTETIDTLVEWANGADLGRTVTAADTLKNIMVKTRVPGGEWELLAIGIPGDREVDEKRLEASLEPAEYVLLTETDFRNNPFLVKGYIGPKALQENGVRYLVDPRVVDGHQLDHGRRRGGQALRGPRRRTGLHPRRHHRGRRGARRRSLARRCRRTGRRPRHRGRARVPARSQVHRRLRRRRAGRERQARPSHHGLVRHRRLPTGRGDRRAASRRQGTALAVRGQPVRRAPRDRQQGRCRPRGRRGLAAELDKARVDVLFDDRKASPGVKFKDSELIGVPLVVVVGRGFAEGNVELRDRFTGESREVPVDAALDEILTAVRS